MTDKTQWARVASLGIGVMLSACSANGSKLNVGTEPSSNSGGSSVTGGVSSTGGAFQPMQTTLRLEAVPSQICRDECTELRTNFSADAGQYSFEWNQSLEEGAVARTVCPQETTEYEVTATAKGGATAEFAGTPRTFHDQVTVTVKSDCGVGNGGDGGLPDGGHTDPIPGDVSERCRVAYEARMQLAPALNWSSARQSVHTNAQGHTLVGFALQGSMETDHGLLQNLGQSAAVLMEFDKDCKEVWSHAISELGTVVVAPSSVVLDDEGNRYVGLYFNGPIDLGTGPIAPALGNFHGAALLKFDSAGRVQWVRQIIGDFALGAVLTASIIGLAVDSAGDLYVHGWAGSTTRLTPNALPLGGGMPGQHPFLAKFSPDGEVLWQQPVGNNTVAYHRMVLGADGTPAILAIVFAERIDFGLGPLDVPSYPPAPGEALLRYDPATGQLLQSSILSVPVDGVRAEWTVPAFAITQAGELAITGITSRSGGDQPIEQGLQLRLYDERDRSQWNRSFYPELKVNVLPNLLVDTQGHFVLAANYSGPVNNAEADGVLVTKWDENGDLLWELRVQTPGTEHMLGAGLTPDDHVSVGVVSNGVENGSFTFLRLQP